MTKKQEEILRKNLGLSTSEFERLKKEKVNFEEIKKERPAFVSTNRPIPPGEKSKILTTHDLDSEGKTKEQKYYDKEKTIPRPYFTTGDVALSEGEEATKKMKEVAAEIKKSKEKKE